MRKANKTFTKLGKVEKKITNVKPQSRFTPNCLKVKGSLTT